MTEIKETNLSRRSIEHELAHQQFEVIVCRPHEQVQLCPGMVGDNRITVADDDVAGTWVETAKLTENFFGL